ncbi:T9SS type A sorting domain-containing protein [candidate division WOR-3 bacterium]|nr:T9SS type A sorting domain-containing protein [candidate division WOR-3 bacterium]
MKYFTIPLLLLVSFCWAGWIPLNTFSSQSEIISVLDQTNDAIEIEVSIPGFNVIKIIENGIIYERISLDNYLSSSLDIGKPEIPVITENIGVPDGADLSYEIIEIETETFKGYTIYPFQEPTTDNSNTIQFTIDKDFYAKDIIYPTSIVKISSLKTWRDINLVNLSIYPFQYNPSKGELTVIKKMKIRINIHGNNNNTKVVARQYNSMYKNSILNYDWMNIEMRDADIHYLAIVYDSYIDEAAPLTDWYYKKGISIDVVPSSTAGSNSSQIKTYITNHYNTYTTDYVLLVGDVAQVPTYTGYSGIPASDAWYSFITGSDLYAELAIGRLSASSPGDVTNIVNKILKYDKDPPLNDWLIKSSLIAHKEDYPGKYSQCKRQIYNFSYTYFTPTMDTIMGALSGQTNSTVTAAINDGRNVVNYRGHGDTYIWWHWDIPSEDWTTSNVNALTNGDETPVVFNIACVCGDISVSECLCECWIRKNPGGAIAALGASNPSYTIPNHDYDKWLYKAYCDSTIWNIGWGSNFAAAKILPSGYYAEQNVKMYLWCGDPLTEIWTAIPTALVVSHSPDVPLGPSNFTVTVTDSKAPVEGALVCAMKDSETWISDYTDASGQVTLSITPTTPGTLYVTVTAHDFLPYEGIALANSGPYCIYESHNIDDVSGGNGDGVISPFETISMSVILHNIGVESAQNVVSNLRFAVANSFITLIDTISDFGDIMPDSLKEGTPPYSFIVAGNCPNGDSIWFEIETIDSAGNDWIQTFFDVVWSPELTYEGFTIDDSGQAHPNGILNAGETVDVIVSLKNWNNYAHATGVSAILKTSNAYITATDSIANFPDMIPGATVDNGSDPFILVASSTLPFDCQVDMELYVTADNCVDTFYYSFIAGERMQEDPTGPDIYSYWAYDMTDTLYTECPVYNWIEIDPNYGGSGTELVLGTNETNQLELPFSFMYYGDNYDTISVCSNGWLALGVTNDTSQLYFPIPDSQGPPACVATFWGMLDPAVTGGVYYMYNSSIHAFIVQWSRVFHKLSEETFEVILYDPAYNPTVTGDGEILCQYYDVNFLSNSCTGIEDGSETIGLMYQMSGSYSPGAAHLIDNFALKFTTDPPEYVGVSESVNTPVYPKLFGLSQNVPNPFYNKTRISYQIPFGKSAHTILKVYDATGRVVRTLVDEDQGPGWYSVTWDGRDGFGKRVSSGVYFTRFTAGNYVKTGKMLYLR